jgi:hypothetical protein
MSSESGSPVRAHGGWVQPFKDIALPLPGVPVPSHAQLGGPGSSYTQLSDPKPSHLRLGGPGPLYAKMSDPEPSHLLMGSSGPSHAQLGGPGPGQTQLGGPVPSHAHPQLWSTQSLPLSPASRSLSSIRQAQNRILF